MKRILIILSCVFVTTQLFAQQSEEKQQEMARKAKITDANYLFLNDQYAKALMIYRELVRDDINNANLNYLAGLCYLKLPFENGRSIPYLERAVKNLTYKYKEGSYKETKAPIDALFWLGYAYHLNKGYTPAQIYYKRYHDTLPVEDVYNIQMVERQIESCKNAKELAKKPVPVEISNLGNYVNSSIGDYNPCVNGDGTILIYTRLRGKNIKDTLNLSSYVITSLEVLESHKDSTDRWSKPVDISSELGTRGHMKTLSLSANGNELLLFKDDLEDGGPLGYKTGSIYYAKRVNGKWTSAKILNSNINSLAWESNASISPSGNEIYFTSDRKGGLGGLDIYVSRKIHGDWGKAENLGSTINTPYDEETPVILPDGKTLFFASEGHYNMGGYDEFYSIRRDSINWSEPINLGYPINSTDDNTFLVPIGDGSKAYYSVARNEGYFTFGEEDIYELEIIYDQTKLPDIQLSGKVTLQDMGLLDSTCLVSAIDTVTKKIVKSVIPDMKTGEYSMNLRPGEYDVKFKQDNYREVTKFISLPKLKRPIPVNMNVGLIPESVKRDKYYEIHNIYFDAGKFELTRESMINIERFFITMNENPGLYVEIIGHCDSRGDENYNKKLSIARSRSVVEYLVKKGIDPLRFVSRGEGKDMLIANDRNKDGSFNEQAARLNRRVEIRILKSDNNMVVTVEELIPDDVRMQTYNRYSIVVKESKESIPLTNFIEVKKVLKELHSMPTQTGFLYYGGDFKNKADATKALNKCIDKGYKDATVVDYFYLNKLNRFIVTNKVNWPIKYTIQLKAADNKILMDAKLVEGIKEVKTSDGFYRYTYKEYTDLNEAEAELKKIIERGFTDAFIIEVSRLK